MAPLLLAIQKNDPMEVASALEMDDAAAFLPLKGYSCGWQIPTALKYGCSVEILRMLCKNGADPFATDNQGIAPLAAVVGIQDIEDFQWGRKSEKGTKESKTYETVQCLLSVGADPSWKGKDGLTAADIARKHGMLKVADSIGAPHFVIMHTRLKVEVQPISPCLSTCSDLVCRNMPILSLRCSSYEHMEASHFLLPAA